MSNMKQLQTMLFNYETTMRTDFRYGEITPLTTTKYKEKPSCVRIRPKPLKDIHTLVDWKVPNVPFELMTGRKEVVRTNPREKQVPYKTLPDLEFEDVKRSRPRLVMTPAASVDDADDVTRKRLLDDVYLTSTMKAQREVVSNTSYNCVRAPLPTSPANANPITIQKWSPPYVSPEWRMDSVTWDRRQLRTYCNPDKEFWLTRTPQCQECKDTAVREQRRKIQR
ncbi:uncharacterized protein LOC131854697 isoform X1 [Achroia grisella]|uniref:uncharacterized protein LOC131854697 isoform X1 n=1 Tax=Achroia grisella TaxID=688607 RepID=UPI0027D2AA99|nr:uncharacterized protein LOC131854697 isoform X1 [Achroia grisella]